MAKKKLKMKRKTVAKKNARPVRKKKVVRRKSKTPKVPKDLRPMVLKKFRSKDRTKRIVVVRLPKDEGYSVRTIGAKEAISTIRDFLVASKEDSSIPTPIWTRVQRELAIWFGRHVAKHGAHPSTKQERSRRRKQTKRSLQSWQEHEATKTVVTELKNGPKAVPLRKRPEMLLPYLCFYNPKCRKNEPVFTIHTAYCGRLEQVRKRMLKKGGTSWVIEATTPERAVALQVAEFKEDDKGYVASDFEIHGCASKDLKRVTSKTVLGKVSSKQRRKGRA